MSNTNQKQQEIQIKAQDEVMKGVYSNAVQIAHTKEEFVLDFLNIYPVHRMGMLNSRVIVSPGHVKRMLAALQDNVKKYESAHGTIETQDPQFNPQVGFETE